MFSETFPAFRKRLVVAYVLLLIAFGVLFFRYWYLQLVKGEALYRAATENTLREVTIPSRRGRILASDGQVLADYQIAYNIMLDRNRLNRNRLPALAAHLGLSPEELNSRLKSFRNVPRYRPVPVLENLGFDRVAWMEAHRKEFPELFVEIDPQRHYPFADLFAHTVGYIGEPTVAEARNLETLQKVGKTGVEKQYDKILRGRDGIRRIVVDSRNRYIRTQRVREPENGQDITLTLVVPLQQAIRQAMGRYQGAVIAMNPNNGAVYAMYSNPSFDPNVLTFRFQRNRWREVRNQKGDPMLNRATQGRYPPGSTFKPIMALSALSHGLPSGTRFTCTGSFEVGGRSFLCWLKTGHGSLTMVDAIAHSCNVYFYQLGLKLGIRSILETAQQFQLGKRIGIDLPGENPGFLPDPEWKRLRTGNPWFPGDTVNLSIGQGYLLTTPIEVAVCTSAIATNGKLVTPHLLKDTGKDWLQGQVHLPASAFATVKKGMRRMVTGGTGVYLSQLGMHIAGKTGTAQTVSGEKGEGLELSWFTGFTPVRNPGLCVVVLAEKGGHGSDTAVPIASKMFELYRDHREWFQ